MPNTTQPTTVKTITPAMAARFLRVQEILETSDPSMRNRNVKEEKVKMYARDMKEDRWELNGETIIFAANGRILDGRHRLLACVEADVAFRTHLVENVPHSAMRTIDTGVIRTAGDQLTIAGKASGSTLAMSLGVLWKWEETGRKGFDWNARPTRLELFAILERHPAIEAFVSRSHRLSGVLSAGLAAALWYIFDQQDAGLAEVFFDALASGLNLKEDDAVYILRERLLKERREQAVHRNTKYLGADYTTDLVYRAWDATRRGVKIAKLQRGSKRYGDRPEVLLTRRVSGSRKRSS